MQCGVEVIKGTKKLYMKEGGGQVKRQKMTRMFIRLENRRPIGKPKRRFERRLRVLCVMCK